MKIKTIWHWKNIFIAIIAIFIIALLWVLITYVFSLEPVISSLVGFLIGFISMLYIMTKLELYHFEVK